MAKKENSKANENIHDELNEARKAAETTDTNDADVKSSAKPDKKKKDTSKSDTKKPAPNNKEADKLKDELAEAKEACEQAKKDADAAKEAHMRTLAEYDNYRKRTAREKEAAYGDAKATTMKELLAVLDNIDRAASMPDNDPEAYKQGVNMIFTSLTDTLKKLGLEGFGEKGDAFDPNIHNAVMHVEDESQDENTVGDVFSKGYKLGDRILRPAMVKVVN